MFLTTNQSYDLHIFCRTSGKHQLLFQANMETTVEKTLGPLNSARRQNKIPRRVRIQLWQSPQKRNGRQFGKPVLAKKLWKYTAFI